MQLYQLEQRKKNFFLSDVSESKLKLFVKKYVKILTKWDFPTRATPVIKKCNSSATFSKTEFICFNLFLAKCHTILNVLHCLKFNKHTAFRKSSSST